MKSTDIAMIVLIASVSIGVAFAAVSAIPGLKTSDELVKVKSIDEYPATLEDPDAAVFNRNAINPTVDVTIGGAPQAGSQ